MNCRGPPPTRSLGLFASTVPASRQRLSPTTFLKVQRCCCSASLVHQCNTFLFFFTNKMENNVVPLYEPASWNSHSRATCCLAQQRRTEKKKTIWKVCIYWRKRKKKEMFLFYIYIYLRQNGLVYIPTGATVLLRWLLLRLRTSTLSGRGRLNVYATISRHNPSLSPKSQKFFLLLPSLNSRRKATKKRKRKFMMMMSGGHHSREVIRPLPFVIDEGVIFSWLHTS